MTFAPRLISMPNSSDWLSGQDCAHQSQEEQNYDHNQGAENIHRYPGKGQVSLEFLQGQPQTTENQRARVYLVQVGLEAIQSQLGRIHCFCRYTSGVNEYIESEIAHSDGESTAQDLQEVLLGNVSRNNQNFPDNLYAELGGRPKPEFLPWVQGSGYSHDVKDDSFFGSCPEGGDVKAGSHRVPEVVRDIHAYHRFQFDTVRSGGPSFAAASRLPAGVSVRQIQS